MNVSESMDVVPIVIYASIWLIVRRNRIIRRQEKWEEIRHMMNVKRLDEEWLKNLPCYGCNHKMQKLCKYYNTFKRPDYNQDQFHIIRITCNDATSLF